MCNFSLAHVIFRQHATNKNRDRGILPPGQKHTAQLSSAIPTFERDGSPKIAGPGVSATYHWVGSLLVTFFPSGFQSIAVSNVPYCLMVYNFWIPLPVIVSSSIR